MSHNWKDKFKSVPEKSRLGTDQPYQIHHFSTLEMRLKACSAPHGTTRFKEKKTLILLLYPHYGLPKKPRNSQVSKR